jgi:acyl-CoA dehydrogenase
MDDAVIPGAALRVDLPARGLEGPLSHAQTALADVAHRFAHGVMRPAAAQLDRLAPDDVVAAGSPYWAVLQQFAAFGIDALTLHEGVTVN